MEGRTRPSTIEVMALTNVIGAISILLFGWLVGSGPLPLISSITIGSQYWVVLVLIVAIVAISNIGIWFGKKWGYALTFLVALLNLVSFAFFIDAVSLIVGILLIYYVTRPLVKDWLRIKMTV
jgi:hypothetical protein